MFQKLRAFRRSACAILLFGLIVSSASAVPEGRAGCTAELFSCYWRAAGLNNWLDRFVAALDCEIEYAGCIRRRIVGA